MSGRVGWYAARTIGYYDASGLRHRVDVLVHVHDAKGHRSRAVYNHRRNRFDLKVTKLFVQAGFPARVTWWSEFER